MKKYRLKEEAKEKLKPYINRIVLNYENTIVEWKLLLPEFSEQFFTCELEEVEERIELSRNPVDGYLINRVDGEIISDQEKQLCEAILNASDGVKGAVLYGGELLDIDSLDIKDFNNYLRGTKYYLANRPILNFVEKDLMEVFLLLKQYLKEKK